MLLWWKYFVIFNLLVYVSRSAYWTFAAVPNLVYRTFLLVVVCMI